MRTPTNDIFKWVRFDDENFIIMMSNLRLISQKGLILKDIWNDILISDKGFSPLGQKEFYKTNFLTPEVMEYLKR
jgi:hypothetical protein